MSATKCPACRADLSIDVNVGVLGEEWAYLWCPSCRWSSDPGGPNPTDQVVFAIAEPLAYFDPRARLPTEAEEEAHRERHGPKAGWSVRIGAVPWFARYPGRESGYLERCEREGWQSASRSNPGRVESYPHVDGRPVRGPEGW